MNQQELLKKILDDHKLWLDSYARKGERANLKGADLRDIDLTGVNLECAQLEGVNLEGATIENVNLERADLEGANLKGAKLRCENLRGTYLIGADLKGADLESANLIYAHLLDAHLEGANLEGANLRYTDLRDAHLEGANLSNASLRGADLSGANVENAILPPSLDNLPEGELIGYKRVKGCIVKLQILADSKRSRATGDKCRCDKALVLAIENEDGTDSGLTKIVNRRYVTTTYQVGKIVYADSWDEDRWVECSHGIHFFLDRDLAVAW